MKHVMALRDAIGKSGTKNFEGFGDLSLTELLPALITRYSETDMMIVAPSLPDQAADIIKKVMRKQWARMDGKGKLDVIRHLTIIADMNPMKSPTASEWLQDNPFPGRLTLVDKSQEDTAILLPDFAITGPVNMRYGEHFVATATADSERLQELWKKFTSMAIDAAAPQTAKEDEEPSPSPEVNDNVEEAAGADAAPVTEEPAGEAPVEEKAAEPETEEAPAGEQEAEEQPATGRRAARHRASSRQKDADDADREESPTD